MRGWVIGLLAVALAAPLSAQEWQVARERFTFVGTRLAIDVDVETAGALRILRGRPGTVEVAGRAQSGFTAFGLDDRERLTLTAAGDGPVDYLVSVPDGVWISVRLPGGYPQGLGTMARSRTFEWDATPAQPAIPTRLPPPPPDASPDPSLYTTYVDDHAPRAITVPDLAVVRNVTVRVEGHRFLVASERPLALEPGSADLLEIRPGGPPMEITLVIPTHTRTLTLRLGDSSALTITDGEIAALCTPLTAQRLSDGRRIFTFIPEEGRLDCRTALDSRHRG